MISKGSKYFKGDRVIWMIAVILAIFSLLAVYSSTGTLAYKLQAGNTEFYLFRQLAILVFGFVIMFTAHLIPYRYYSRISQLLLFLVIPLLAITLIAGTSINQASRWLTLPGMNITFQTSDFAKLVLVMFVARKLAKSQDTIQDWKTGFRPVIIPVFLVTLLILPANFSTAMVVFITALVIMFVGRVNMKYIGIMVASGIVLLVFVVLIASVMPRLFPRMDTWVSRIESFSGESEEVYQVEQSKIAVATGGIIGKRPGHSIQRNYLPHPYSDFIFAIIVEEYGLAGGALLVMLYLMLLYRGVRLATKAPGTFGALLAVGLSFSLVFQAFINMAVAVNLMPVTGQPLPMVSMGGTSIWFSCLAIGILLSVSRVADNQNNEKNSYA
ncbi:MAG: FtsW/RodA/SpoVE family cell cycle protein [Bacteroidales bacterium]